MYKLIIFLSLFICATGCKPNKPEQPNAVQYRVIAYVHGWNDIWGEDNEKANKITHINYAFANIAEGKVIEGQLNDGEILKKLNGLKEVNKELKILISVGGWSWSKNFSDAVLTPNSRQMFANSAIGFMLRHRLDGIDLDWEYPGQKGDNNRYRAEDKENFTKILKLLRKKLDSVETPNNPYLLTIATGANQNYLDHTNMKEAHQYLDFINIMTYDFLTGGSPYSGHHANLQASMFDLSVEKKSCQRAIDEHIAAGIPAHKIVIGTPFYGRYWKAVNPQNNGLYQRALGNTGTYGYKDIADSINAKKFKSYWDQSALAPYIWRERDSLFISYDNAMSLKHKIAYLKNKGLGGVMFWEINGDNGDLLKIISESLK